ncbi:OPT8 [Candida oxycetoniae]|uniref:OPT8 n=1 Tax=Candida oxycetoniae TaxID=497107 RepID=A0AAI9WY67_9ASCO|nr:OPT8 [Candida oxycetoniae]KAI3404967.2 OPT8 [Candida oxycetoniae]
MSVEVSSHVEVTGERKVGYLEKLSLPQVTIRATLVGLVIGSVILISNFQFGLQTGWVSMMSLPAALLGFATFKLTPLAQDFTDVENVYIQSIAVAVGTGPLAYGFIGIIPAIEKFLTPQESGIGKHIIFSTKELIIWSMGLGLFGVFFAIPLRNQVIIKEKLAFPSGSATATLISVLHGTEVFEDESDEEAKGEEEEEAEEQLKNLQGGGGGGGGGGGVDFPSLQRETSTTQLLKATDYNSNMQSLGITFGISAVYTIVSFFFPILKRLPIFGTWMSKRYLWDFQPSPAYIGQGIIMGLPTVSYILFGAILGWGVLAPLSKHMKWAPGEIDDWMEGGQGWILWISLSIMVADSLISFIVLSIKSVISFFDDLKRRERLYANSLELQQPLTASYSNPGVNDETINSHNTTSSKITTSTTLYAEPRNRQKVVEVPSEFLISNKVAIVGTIFSSILCICTLYWIFGELIPIYASITAILLAMLFSVLATRTLGVSDINPVSGIGKLSQLIFALIIPSDHPAKVLINLISGGVAEAGAQQAGDLMQDLKTGHMVGAAPKAQFVAQIIGTIFSVFLSSIMYRVYQSIYEIPNDIFRIPTAIIWIDCSRLVTGEGLPPKAMEFSIVFGVVFALISLLKNTLPQTSKFHKHLVWLPNGVAVGIGIYNTPNFTLARFLGGLIAYYWARLSSRGRIGMIIFSSGLVLGEGLLSGFTMLLTSLGVKHF